MPKRVIETPLTGKTKSGKILSEQEEAFCNYYVQNFNRIDAAIHAYNVDIEKKNWKYTASNIAYENLLRPYINERIRELLDQYHVNEQTIDNETAFIMRQNAELPSKLGAIKELNRILGRYEKDNEQQKDEINLYSWSEYEKKQDNDLPPEMVDQTASREQKEMDCDSGSS